MDQRNGWAVACMAGSFKGVFVHGALHGLEAGGFRAAAYGAASSSTLPAAFAAAGRARQQDLGIWTECDEIVRRPGTSMSDAILASLERCVPQLLDRLFAPGASRFCVAVSHVHNAEAAAITQGTGARRLGRRLLIDAARHDTTWRDQNLRPQLFDTAAADPSRRITPDNLAEVAYATTRMMHAWDIPATIGGEPYVDASYTCQCPAAEMIPGCTGLLIIATEPAAPWRDIFGAEPLLPADPAVPVVTLAPERDLKEIGVDFQRASREGLEQAFQEGFRAAERFLAQL